MFQGRGPYAAVQYAALGNRPTMRAEGRQYETFAAVTAMCWAAESAERPTFVQLQQLMNAPDFVVPCLVPIANIDGAERGGVVAVSVATDRII